MSTLYILFEIMLGDCLSNQQKPLVYLHNCYDLIKN